jgi:hypothetical protein
MKHSTPLKYYFSTTINFSNYWLTITIKNSINLKFRSNNILTYEKYLIIFNGFISFFIYKHHRYYYPNLIILF